MPVEIRHYYGSARVQQGQLVHIKVKMLAQGSREEPTSVRVELSSETDLFFHYVHTIDEDAFALVQSEQKLMVNFSEYQNVLIQMFNSCIREPQSHSMILSTTGECDARLDFIQNMAYKFVELMSLSFQRSPEETVQRQITYRYTVIKQRLSAVQSRLLEITSLVKTKNPSLLLQLHKGCGGGGPCASVSATTAASSASSSSSSSTGCSSGSSISGSGGGGTMSSVYSWR